MAGSTLRLGEPDGVDDDEHYAENDDDDDRHFLHLPYNPLLYGWFIF